MDALFAVQDEDVAQGQLEHRRSHLPERTALDEAEAARQATVTEVERIGLERLDHARRQKRYEGEVVAVEARLADLDGKLYGGAITSPKEATSLQDEMGHLRKRQDDLEGQVLEIMELIEPLDAELLALAAIGESQDAMLAGTRALLDETEASIVADLAASAERRLAAVAEVPNEVLARYEKGRPSFGSSAVVRFSGSDCSGCPYSMPAVEADRVKSMEAGTLTDCSECGRLVVR
ncbi:MAG: hypothetical protein VX219_07875 [Actinomycetota bacterium]|nr:hypothetical protein [Actinomycetota bacterium]MEE3354096.1 hypothetical protein [Actinomycetota bacterium]